MTLFPEFFAPQIGLSVLGRAVEAGLVRIATHNPLDELEPGERADAPPFGGGPGMVVRVPPLARILDRLIAAAPPDERRLLIVTSPVGARFDQTMARRFADHDRLVLLCGRYEGIDERVQQLYPCEAVSLGDFVLTGGEIVAMAILDATARLREGTLRPASLDEESFTNDLLEYPTYTRPALYRGHAVPEVLLSGDHAAIAAWRREQSRERTRRLRPDLLAEEQ